VKGCVTSRTSLFAAWMIALVHYTGLHGTARMAQATENDVGLPQPVFQPTALGTDGRAPSNASNHAKNALCLKLI